jgi:hypothetical protein
MRNVLVTLIGESEQSVMENFSTYRKTTIRDHGPNMLIKLLLFLLMGCEKSHGRCQYACCSLVTSIIVQWRYVK